MVQSDLLVMKSFRLVSALSFMLLQESWRRPGSPCNLNEWLEFGVVSLIILVKKVLDHELPIVYFG